MSLYYFANFLSVLNGFFFYFVWTGYIEGIHNLLLSYSQLILTRRISDETLSIFSFTRIPMEND